MVLKLELTRLRPKRSPALVSSLVSVQMQHYEARDIWDALFWLGVRGASDRYLDAASASYLTLLPYPMHQAA